MLEYLHNPNEASYLLTELAEKILVDQGDVITKLNYIDRVVTAARTPVLEEDAETLKGLMSDRSMAKYFKGNPSEHLKSGNYRAIAAISTEAHLKGVISYVAASGLIFAHSFLEESLDTTLKITRLVDIESWLSFISDRTVTVGSIVDKSLEAAIEDKITSFVTTLRRDGILKQIDVLAKILRKSITKSGVRDYNYDREKIVALDDLRHRQAHRRSTEYTIDNARKDVRYLQLTALHFLDLVTFKYDLHGANRPK
jgi:hypothetical protein